MKSLVQKLFAEPRLDVEEQERRARLLGMILWFSVSMNILNMSLMLITGADYIFWIDLLLLGCQFGLIVLYKRGYVHIVSILMVTISWLFIASGFNTFTNVLSLSYSIFFLLIIIAGLLLGGYGAGIVAVCSIVFGGLNVIFFPSDEAQSIFINSSVIMVCLAFLMYMTQYGLNQALSRIRAQERITQNTNERLEQEIEERKAMATRIKESEARYRALIEYAPVGMIVNDLEGTIQFVNDHALRMFGAESADEMINRKSWGFFPDANIDLMRSRLETLKIGDIPPRLEYKLKTLSDDLIDVEVGSLPFVFEGKTAVMGIINDITERRRAQEERIQSERLNVELEQQRQYSKMRDEFIALMSHEFRTPLSVINSSKDILQRYAPKLTPDKIEGYYAKIGDQIVYMVSMLDHILALSQASAGILRFQPAPDDLHALCENILAEHREMDQHKHTLQFISDLENEHIVVDSFMIAEIINQLLWNSRNFTPDGTTILLSLAYKDDNVVITVQDDGNSLLKEEIPHLFNPFFRGANAKDVRGAGLGLAVVQEYTYVHNGTISIHQDETSGTQFTVTVPRQQSVDSEHACPATADGKDANVTDSDYNNSQLETNTITEDADGQNKNHQHIGFSA